MIRRPLIFTLLTLAVTSPAWASRTPGQPKDPFDAGAWLGAKPASGDDIGATMKTVAGSMGDITTDLGQQKTDSPVQLKQKDVTGKLDTMIAALDKACNGGGSGADPNPTKGLKKSILGGGPGGEGALHDAKAGEKQWGQLKAKDREQILQSKTDGFPAGYESLLQSYYRRLSAEDNTQPAASPAAATPAPTPTAGSNGENAKGPARP